MHPSDSRQPDESQLRRAIEQIQSPAAADRTLNVAGSNAARCADPARLARSDELLGAEVAAMAQAAMSDDPEVRSQADALVQQTFGAEGAKTEPDAERARRLLRQAVARKMRPANAVDAILFAAVNRLPHPKLLDHALRALSWVMTGGTGWFLIIAALTLGNRKRGWSIACATAPALWLATYTVEHPVKTLFRRRRPFLSLVKAIVVGRKPGSFSFPSGHSAAAFAGAALLSTHLPKQRLLFRSVALLVAFSRVYLGAHYPGDVVIGSLLGTGLSRFYSRLLDLIRRGVTALVSGK